MAAEAQRGDGDFDDDDPDDDESPVMSVLLTIDRIHDLPELFARGSCRFWTGGSIELINRGIVLSVGYGILDLSPRNEMEASSLCFLSNSCKLRLLYGNLSPKILQGFWVQVKALSSVAFSKDLRPRSRGGCDVQVLMNLLNISVSSPNGEKIAIIKCTFLLLLSHQ